VNGNPLCSNHCSGTLPVTAAATRAELPAVYRRGAATTKYTICTKTVSHLQYLPHFVHYL
jgi:hypothetical protein